MHKLLIHREKMNEWLIGSAYRVSGTPSLSKTSC